MKKMRKTKKYWELRALCDLPSRPVAIYVASRNDKETAVRNMTEGTGRDECLAKTCVEVYEALGI